MQSFLRQVYITFAKVDVFYEKGSYTAADADKQIQNPGASTPVILCLNNDRMPDAYGEKGHRRYDNACKIHISLIFCAKIRINANKYA
jgi:hypothetical protein